MTSIKTLTTLLILPLLGCSSLQSPGDNQRPIESLIPTIQQRVTFAARIAFSIESVKPYKEEACQAVNAIATYLDNYSDPDFNLEQVRQIVLTAVSQIQNEQIREATRAVTELMLSEAFNFAWQHYSNFINQDETKAAILIAQAVANGMREACN